MLVWPSPNTSIMNSATINTLNSANINAVNSANTKAVSRWTVLLKGAKST